MASINTLQDALALLGTHTAGAQAVFLEWSIAVRPALASAERFTLWLGRDQSGFAPIQAVLGAVGAPAEVRAAQADATADGVRQGLGVAATEQGLQWRLYLHTRARHALQPTYRSLRWDPAGAIGEDQYSFHYLPALASGETPDQLVHPDCAEVMGALLHAPRVQELSKFFVRKNGTTLRQVDLTFGWHPLLGSLDAPLRVWCSHIGAPTGWLEEFADHPVRHVAFSGPGGPPSATVYFSAAVGRDAWPGDLDALRERVRHTAESARRATEESTFARLPPTPPPDPSIGTVYDTNDVSRWRAVLGPGLHEHFGIFAQEDPVESRAERALERAVTVLYPHIPPGCRVYDMGCGWGGPALQLVRDLGCRVEGITASGSQFRWCNAQGLLVRHADMEATLPPGRFDVVLMLESFGHVRDKRRLLRRLRPLARRLILREHCQDATPASVGFDATMYLERSADVRQMLEETGWRITAWVNRRAASMPTIALWEERLRDVPPSDDRHLETLRAFCSRVAANADTWARSHPLIEVVAE